MFFFFSLSLTLVYEGGTFEIRHGAGKEGTGRVVGSTMFLLRSGLGWDPMWEIHDFCLGEETR